MKTFVLILWFMNASGEVTATTSAVYSSQFYCQSAALAVKQRHGGDPFRIDYTCTVQQ
jgi:hypothetical protein